MTNRDGAAVVLVGAYAGIIGVLLLLLFVIGMKANDTCSRTYKQWDVLQETILDCMEHPACYITPGTLMQVRTLAPQVAECERKEYDE